MPETRLGSARLGAVVGLAALTLVVGLGGSGRLTYHEAFVAQAAREMIASGDVLTPTVGGLPWLEKPPLAIWLVALLGKGMGGVTEAVARAPSAVAAALLAVGVALLAARRFGPSVGLLAGLIQATTVWTVVRGRLAEADMELACLVTWTLVAFDHLRAGPEPLKRWRWGFFTGLGMTCLSKGVGFGATLVLAVVAATIAWDRDREALRRLRSARGWILAGVLGLTWPVLAALRHPSALSLWFLHVSDRLAARPEHFAGQTWWQYTPALLTMLLPWTPLVLTGAWRSLPGAVGRESRGRGDRLLWAWTVMPLVLLGLATVKNAHYAIHALPPCSVWAAQGLLRLGGRLQSARGWSPTRVRRVAWVAFGSLGLAYAVGFAALGPSIDRRGVEWAFYQDAAKHLRPGEPVALLYHVPDWDRTPYETPFGSFPHDWAVRLYYLDHPASCRFGLDELAPELASADFAVIGREADLPGLAKLGRVETLAQGPNVRSDRTYRLYRVTPSPIAARDDKGLRR